MIEVTEGDKGATGLLADAWYQHGKPVLTRDATWIEQAFATHRTQAAKAERDRLRDLPDEVAVMVSDKAILLLDIAEADGRLSRLVDEVRQAVADALEEQQP